jgi:hypothetical protein
MFQRCRAGLGHKDGGTLAMKTYGHLRREHSVAQALKVSFAPVATKQAEVIPFPAMAWKRGSCFERFQTSLNETGALVP